MSDGEVFVTAGCLLFPLMLLLSSWIYDET